MPTNPSRLLTRDELLRYLGKLSLEVVLDRIARGKLPGPLWKVAPDHKEARWDRRAVDRALDAESSIPGSLDAQEREWDRAFGLG